MRDTEKRSRKFAKVLRKNLTSAEAKLWNELRARRLSGHKFRRQHPIGPYIADFANLTNKLVIEVDGDTHSTQAEITHDAKRTAFLEQNGWTVLRCWNGDVYDNIDGVCEAILRALDDFK